VSPSVTWPAIPAAPPIMQWRPIVVLPAIPALPR
jgi:hypothetical protein